MQRNIEKIYDNMQRIIDKNVDLYPIKESFKQKKWILPLKDDIKGL